MTFKADSSAGQRTRAPRPTPAAGRAVREAAYKRAPTRGPLAPATVTSASLEGRVVPQACAVGTTGVGGLTGGELSFAQYQRGQKGVTEQ